MRVSAPASTANLGAGFDALAMALDERFHLITTEPAPDERFSVAGPRHPATQAFVAAGGDGPIWFRTTIAPGKGMGYSGAAAVAGAAAALATGGSVDLDRVLSVAADVEGHHDNAAASTHGGCVVAADGHVVRLAPPPGLAVVQWIPQAQTSTSSSRGQLPAQVDHATATTSVGRAAMMVAGLATGDRHAIAVGSNDVLHQPTRLAAARGSVAAIAAAIDDGAVAAWLSGSGPSVCALVELPDRERIAETLRSMTDPATAGAHVKLLDIALDGVLIGESEAETV